MSRLAIAVAVVLIAWAGAFGVAVGVVEWRDGGATMVEETNPADSDDPAERYGNPCDYAPPDDPLRDLCEPTPSP